MSYLPNHQQLSSDDLFFPRRAHLPPSNYLWTSPNGTSYPGWHHQLILSLLSHDQNWYRSFPCDFTVIKARLQEDFPGYMMEDQDLTAIANEHFELDQETRLAYAQSLPSLPNSRQNDFIESSSVRGTEINSDDFDWDSFIHPALFDHNGLVSTPPTSQFSGSSPQVFEGEVSPGYRNAGPPAPQSRSDGFGHDKSLYEDDSFWQKSFGKPLISNIHLANPKSRDSWRRNVVPGVTNFRSEATPLVDSGQTSGRDRSTQRSRSNQRLPFDLPASRSTLSTDLYDSNSAKQTSTITAPADRGIGQPLLSTTAMNDSDKGTKGKKTSINNMTPEHNSPSKSIAPTEESEMRLPDPSKYFQTSKNHFTIPASEAAAFVHWFEPKVDGLPDVIEGYYWYCDQCFVNNKNHSGGGWIRGRFRQKRSIEKHFASIHRIAWQPVLPEPDRDTIVDPGPAAEERVDTGPKIGEEQVVDGPKLSFREIDGVLRFSSIKTD